MERGRRSIALKNVEMAINQPRNDVTARQVAPLRIRGDRHFVRLIDYDDSGAVNQQRCRTPRPTLTRRDYVQIDECRFLLKRGIADCRADGNRQKATKDEPFDSHVRYPPTRSTCR